MFLKKYKPKINSMRQRVLLRLSKYFKFKRLIYRLRKINGRSTSGRIINKYKGGGVFYMYRRVDYSYTQYNYNYTLIGFDKSWYTSSLLALVNSTNGIKKYIIAPQNFGYNNSINTTFFFKGLEDNLGSAIPIGWIPNNTFIYNLEINPCTGFKLIRSAGTFGKIVSHTTNNVLVQLPSKKKKKISKYSLACIGRVSNLFHKFQNYSKAGYLRNLNIRPKTTGESMNSCDHPNGGRTHGGKPTKNYWGKVIK